MPGVFLPVPLDCHGKSLWCYRCSVLFVCVLCSTEVYVYAKISTYNKYYCLFSQCVLVPFKENSLAFYERLKYEKGNYLGIR